MSDASPESAEMVRARLMALTGAERFRMGVQMFDAARRMTKLPGTATTMRLLPLLLLLLSTAVRAGDFTYTTNDGEVAITGYTGPGGAVTIPDTIDNLPVLQIWFNAFGGQSSITSVVIPDGVIHLRSSAFFDCANLTHATIGDGVVAIETAAFANCFSLTGVTIGQGVTSIKEHAFYGHNMPYVTIPAGVTNIGQRAFGRSEQGSGVAGAYFRGNAPIDSGSVFENRQSLQVYYQPGTSGWGTTFSGNRTVPWNPKILTSNAMFGVGTKGFGFQIQLGGLGINNNYITVVRASTDLSSGVWIPLTTNYPTLLPSVDFIDPHWTNWPARFYVVDMP